MINNVEKLSKLFFDGSFIENYWKKQPCMFDGGEHFLASAGLLSGSELIQLYAEKFPESLEYIENGFFRTVLKNYPRKFNTSEVAEYLAKRRVMIVENLGLINEFYKDLAKIFAQQLQMYLEKLSAFVSTANFRGARQHGDSAEVFIFQHQGDCQWQVYDRSGTSLLMDVVLSPGKILYIPHSFEHQVKRLTNSSCHVHLSLK